MERILLVENNPFFREVFTEHLSSHFHSFVIEAAESGKEALEKINIHPPALIFMDLRLPGISGLEATQKIKQAFPEVRVAILTGYDLPEYREAATRYGAEGFFVKESLKWDEVEALVESIEKTIS
jgi:DNA-binding NarL/FixJ family response regulator